jgi:rhodanese-related sulfurtransferase
MAEIGRISPQEASKKLAEGWTYVDVRTVEEFGAGHPPGAVNVPLMLAAGGRMAPNPDFVHVMQVAFTKDAKIVVGCKAGGRSLRAAQMLSAHGFTSVLDQGAGWDGARSPFGQVTDPGWSRLDLPVEEGQVTGRSWSDMKKKAGERVASKV